MSNRLSRDGSKCSLDLEHNRVLVWLVGGHVQNQLVVILAELDFFLAADERDRLNLIWLILRFQSERRKFDLAFIRIEHKHVQRVALGSEPNFFMPVVRAVLGSIVELFTSLLR